jgi:serine/threonine protein kinase
MVIQAACPGREVIRDLLSGSLPENEQSELSSHFDLCPTCQQTFDAEAAGPEFLGDVARLCSDSDWQQNTPTLDRLLRDIPQQLSDAADEASVATWSTEAVADFLEASENADHIGRLGTYEIVEVIGRGGMGIVLRGIDSRLNRVVAIKVLAPELASNPNARRRFYREGQAAAAVSHDHVVTIHAVDDHERLPYLVMEFVAGESLEECIRRTGALPLESILRMGRQTALGLAAAHEVGLVHRDMKPANILLENGIQRVRITDFGLARASDDVSMTQTGTVSGTPLYMSPEQAGGEAVDHRSDLFSLGSVLYAMCTGRPAFRAQTTLAVIKRVCEDTPRPIREVNPDIPHWLVDIIDRLMAKQPVDRIQSAAELAELLGSHLAHLRDPENVPAPTTATTMAKTAARPRVLRSLLLAILLIGGIGLGIAEAAGVTNVSEFLGIVLRLKTPEGTLVIEIEDPDVDVSVDGSEVVLSGITKNELRLKPGKYQYTAIREGKPAESEWVTIERDGRTVVRIRQLPLVANANAAAPEPPSDVSLNDIDFEPFVQSMRARHVWVHARFFERKTQLELAALCCTEIRRLYPRSEFIERANAKLEQLEKQGQPIPNAPHIDPASEFWRQAQTFEQQGRLDLAIALCSHIMLTYPDSKYGEIAEQKYEALEDTGPGSAGLAELFWTQTLVYEEEGEPKLAEEMRTAVVQDFPQSLYADVIRKRLNSTEAGRLWTAVLAFEANVPEAAVVCCNEIVKKFPQSSHASPARAKIKLWNKSGLPSLESVGDPAKFLWELALLYRQSGNVETAMLLCSRVPILFPNSLYVSRVRGLLAELMEFGSNQPPVEETEESVRVGGYEQTVASPGAEPTTRTVGDGIRLLSPVRVRRLVPDQLAPVWFGKWYFKQIPEQLYGQNFAFVSRDGGQLEFDVTDVNGRNLSQRIWLLIPHQDWDGSRTTSIPEDIDPSLKFATRESLLAFGWSAWNDITSEHIRVTPDQPEHHMQWSVFYRDAKPGEKYRIRTHWKHTPMLVWGSTQLDNVIVEPEWDQRVAVFGPRATVPHGNGNLVFDHAPEAINGRLFTKRNGYQGAARFRVQSDQKVTVAMYEWGHEHEGNASGNWTSELTSRREMAEQGWQAAGEVASRHSDPKLPGVNWFLYTRDCKASESFVLRNHKYQAPILFSEKTYSETGPVEVAESPLSEHARRQAEERIAKLGEEFNSMIEQQRFAEACEIAQQAKREFPKSSVSDTMLEQGQMMLRITGPAAPDIPGASNTILLDHSTVQSVVARPVGEPAAFGTHGAGSGDAKLPALFFGRQTEHPSDGYIGRDGYGLLLGQIPVSLHGRDHFELERFERTGNQLRIVFRQYATNFESSAETDQRELSTKAADGQPPQRSLYFGTPLPMLPPGDYDVTAEVRVLLHPGEPDDLLTGATDPRATKPDHPETTPRLEESSVIKGHFAVSAADVDAAELKRIAALAIVLKPAEHEAFDRPISSPLNVDLSELITRIEQLEDVQNLPGDLTHLPDYLEQLRRVGKKWAMCAALDIEQPQSKIIAARALGKLADPDTVSVLLIAAKRNAYAVTDGEFSFMHSIYQGELNHAIEAATGLTNLSHAGLTINIPALGPATGETFSVVTNFPEMFRVQTDFKRVDEWLRTVYLADSVISAKPDQPRN